MHRRKIKPIAPRPDLPSKRCWMSGVRTGWRTLKLRLCVSDPLSNSEVLMTSQRLRVFMEERLSQIVRCGPSPVSTYLGLLSEEPANAYWHQVFGIISSLTTGDALDWMYGFANTNVPQYLRPSQDFEEFLKNTIITVLEDGTDNFKQALSLLERPGLFPWVRYRILLAYRRYQIDSCPKVSCNRSSVLFPNRLCPSFRRSYAPLLFRGPISKDISPFFSRPSSAA